MAARRLRGVLPLAEAVAAGMCLSGPTECLKAYREACEDAMRQNAGDVIETPSATALPAPPQAPTTATKGHAARDAFDAWKAAKPGRPRGAETTYEAAADKLTVLMGGKTLEKLTRADGRAITEGLLEEAAMKRWLGSEHRGEPAGALQDPAGASYRPGVGPPQPAGRPDHRVSQANAQAWLPAQLVTLFDDPLFNAYDIPRPAAAGEDAA